MTIQTLVGLIIFDTFGFTGLAELLVYLSRTFEKTFLSLGGIINLEEVGISTGSAGCSVTAITATGRAGRAEGRISRMIEKSVLALRNAFSNLKPQAIRASKTLARISEVASLATLSTSDTGLVE